MGRCWLAGQLRLMPVTEFLEPDLMFRLPEERLFAFAALWEE